MKPRMFFSDVRGVMEGEWATKAFKEVTWWPVRESMILAEGGTWVLDSSCN
ncbi:MAG: hypothetical protein KIH01_01085 [Candidatus Freyarchaeota archaeon]|nr:hypothetical protein [Candidatus Jordarchaeia archaeon]